VDKAFLFFSVGVNPLGRLRAAVFSLPSFAMPQQAGSLRYFLSLFVP